MECIYNQLPIAERFALAPHNPKKLVGIVEESAGSFPLASHKLPFVVGKKSIILSIFIVILALPMRKPVFPLPNILILVFVFDVLILFLLKFVLADHRKESGPAAHYFYGELDVLLISERLNFDLDFLGFNVVYHSELPSLSESAFLELSNIPLVISKHNDPSALQIAIPDLPCQKQTVKSIINMDIVGGGKLEGCFFERLMTDLVELLLDILELVGIVSLCEDVICSVSAVPKETQEFVDILLDDFAAVGVETVATVCYNTHQ